MLFIMLAMLKHGDQWDTVSKIFSLERRMFERVVIHFINSLSEPLYESQIQNILSIYSYTELVEERTKCNNFPFAKYVTDMTIQQANRLSR